MTGSFTEAGKVRERGQDLTGSRCGGKIAVLNS
jgi:hypothetical protein